MKKRGRKPLPDDQRKVRVEVYAPAAVVDDLHSIAREKGTTVSEFTAKLYRKAQELYRPQKSEVIQT